MIYLTVDKIMAFGPCPDWPRERVASVFGRRKRLSLCDLLRCDGITITNRVWLGCHALPPREARLLACLWATRLLKAARAVGREPAAASWAAVRVARQFANGRATKEELAAARAAWVAVGMEAAAGAVVGAAAAEAARAAAGVEAAAAWCAAEAKAFAYTAARKQQLRDIIRIVKRLEKGGGR